MVYYIFYYDTKINVIANGVDFRSISISDWPSSVPIVTQLSPTTPIHPLDQSLCLICQRFTKEEFAKTISVSKIERILKSCKDHHCLKTGKYKQLYNRVIHRKLSEMPNCKYHNTCLRKLSRDEKYIIRAHHIKTSTEQKDNSAGKSD